ncbi:hypothetical protein PR048_019629 [Dryococelus australis]|uniref:Uncharacterized protein n=1 Tax=Dryococelus australis TaxID=614101 RepID=A0ABQ9H4C0_9NEOP|nr:hypothetical protein PR048_019629 [Dryococelus australis]
MQLNTSQAKPDFGMIRITAGEGGGSTTSTFSPTCYSSKVVPASTKLTLDLEELPQTVNGMSSNRHTNVPNQSSVQQETFYNIDNGAGHRISSCHTGEPPQSEYRPHVQDRHKVQVTADTKQATSHSWGKCKFAGEAMQNCNARNWSTNTSPNPDTPGLNNFSSHHGLPTTAHETAVCHSSLPDEAGLASEMLRICVENIWYGSWRHRTRPVSRQGPTLQANPADWVPLSCVWVTYLMLGESRLSGYSFRGTIARPENNTGLVGRYYSLVTKSWLGTKSGSDSFTLCGAGLGGGTAGWLLCLAGIFTAPGSTALVALDWGLGFTCEGLGFVSCLKILVTAGVRV